MAKNSFKTSFTKASINKDGDKYIITETSKDEETSYDLTTVLDGLIGVENISLSINKDSDLKPIEE